MNHTQLLFQPAGDKAIIAELGNTIDPETNRQVHSLVQAIDRMEIYGILDLVPSYGSLLINFDPMRISIDKLKSRIVELNNGPINNETSVKRVVHLPVFYGGNHGPDIKFVAEHACLTVEEVINLHSSIDYFIYMMGFAPGFPYLGELPKNLATPRLQTPRTHIPAGSVGIAESQTGVYPTTSPGGWQVIGRTPLKLFDVRRKYPALLLAGDFVRFIPMTGKQEYERIRKLADKNDYEIIVDTRI